MAATNLPESCASYQINHGLVQPHLVRSIAARDDDGVKVVGSYLVGIGVHLDLGTPRLPL